MMIGVSNDYKFNYNQPRENALSNLVDVLAEIQALTRKDALLKKRISTAGDGSESAGQ